MNILVAVATRHGATLAIAETVASTIGQTADADVDVVALDDVTSVDGYDAVVLGSAVYMGRWLGVARKFVDAHATELAARPVWLFSSGPIGDPPQPNDDPVGVPELMRVTHARGHQTFSGRLQRHGLHLAEKTVVRALHVPDGDFRDFDAVKVWATDIGHALATE